MKKRLVELDGLRGLAVMMVVFGHAGGTLSHGYTGWLSPLQLLPDGEMGVRIFFILSGFLITSILVAEYDWTKTICLLDFYKRRVLRIFPAFYTYLIVVTVLSVLGILPVAPQSLFLAATFLLNYMDYIVLSFHLKSFDDIGYAVVGHFWTLSLEEQFYWVWPFALIFFLRKKAFFFVPILICVIPVIRFATYFLSPGTRGQLGMMFHTGSDVILFGCLLAICAIRRPVWVNRLILPSWAITGLMLFTLIMVPRMEQIFPSPYFHKLWAATNYSVESLLLTVIIANILLQPQAWYTRLLKTRVLVFLGTISYSIYLWQQLFCFSFNTTVTGQFPLNIVCAIGVGYLSYRFIERPFLLVKSKRYSHGPGSPG